MSDKVIELPEKKFELATKLEERRFRTPDFHYLRFRKEIPLFVYDGMKKYGGDEDYMKKALFLGKAMTLTTGYEMQIVKEPAYYPKQSVSYPMVFLRKDGGHAIRGEIYLVTPQHILAIDKAMEHSVYTRRHFIKVYCEDQTYCEGLKKNRLPHALQKIWLSAYMYIGEPNMFKGHHKTHRPAVKLANPTNPLEHREFYEYEAWESNAYMQHGFGYDWPDDEDIYRNSTRNPHGYM